MKSRPIRILFGAAGFGMIGLLFCFLLLLGLAGPDTAIRWCYAGYWISFAIGLPLCRRRTSPAAQGNGIPNYLDGLMTKWTFVSSIALLVAACSHAPWDSHGFVLVDVPDGSDCLDTSRHDKVPLTVTNRSTHRIAFFAERASGPPYVLHPYAFAIDFAEPKSENNVEALLDEYVPPKHEVQLGPGDRAEVLAYADLWPRPGYSGKVRAQLIDTNGRQHLSKELAVCTAAEMSATGR